MQSVTFTSEKITLMKLLLFLVSLAGFLAALYFLCTDGYCEWGTGQSMYILLLIVLMLNSSVGLFLTAPALIRRFKKK